MADASCAETMPLSSIQRRRDVDLSVSAEDRGAAEELLRAIRCERGGIRYLASVIGVSDAAVRLWTPIPSVRVRAVLQVGANVLAELRRDVPCIEGARSKVSPAEAGRTDVRQVTQRKSAGPSPNPAGTSLAPMPAGGRLVRGIDPFATRECLVGPAAPRRAPNAAFDRLEAALARGPLVMPQPIPALSAARKPSREEMRIAARLREGQVLRRCLCCDEPFAADGRFQRLCERHRRQS